MTNNIGSRQLKFKVWDEALGMSEPFELGAHRVVFNHNKTKKISHIDLSMKFLQFTGLKDCEGNEIYEGDIVESWIYLDYLHINYSKGVFLASSKFVAGDVIKYRTHSYTIVGNIYENPELVNLD